MRTAGAWLARRDRGFSATEQEEFARWLRANPRHARAVAQLERTMATFDRLRAFAPHAPAPPDRDFFAPPPARRWFYPSLAALGIAATLLLSFWLGPSGAPARWHYATAPGGYERARLIDGSTIELNGGTSLDVEFTPAQRQVRLIRGEAHFQVAKDPAHPFVVTANAVAVSAVGTAFNVRVGQVGVEVLVTEGRVRVEPPPPPPAPRDAPASVAAPAIPLLTAGQKIVVSSDTRSEPAKIAVLSPEEIERTLAWQPRVAEFAKTPLREVVAAFNRQNRQQIVVDDPELDGLRIGGNFRTDQPDAFVRLLETSFGIEAERTEQVIRLRKLRGERKR